MKVGHDAAVMAFPSKINGFDDPSFSRVPILPQRSCAVGSVGLYPPKWGPQRETRQTVRRDWMMVGKKPFGF